MDGAELEDDLKEFLFNMEKSAKKVLKEQLIAKVKGLGEVEAKYSAIINIGAGEWGLAALVALGQAYENMGWTLDCDNSYVPSYLTADQRDLYCMGLEDKAYLQEEKALNAYKLALEKAYEFNLYNENTAMATRRLGELRPDEYAPLEEDLLEARYTAASADQRTFRETAE